MAETYTLRVKTQKGVEVAWQEIVSYSNIKKTLYPDAAVWFEASRWLQEVSWQGRGGAIKKWLHGNNWLLVKCVYEPCKRMCVLSYEARLRLKLFIVSKEAKGFPLKTGYTVTMERDGGEASVGQGLYELLTPSGQGLSMQRRGRRSQRSASQDGSAPARATCIRSMKGLVL